MGGRRRKRRASNVQPKVRPSRHGESPSETGRHPSHAWKRTTAHQPSASGVPLGTVSSPHDSNPPTPRRRPATLLKSFGFALRGLREAVVTDRNVRIHLAAAVAVSIAAVLLDFSALELALITLTVGLVIAAELMNTAIETAVDLASPEVHTLARRAKDIAAGAVLVAAIAAAGVGLLLFLPKL